MKANRIFGRNIRDSFKSVFRNLSLSMASIMCITITLIVVSISIILTYNVNNFTKEVEKDVTIVVFLDPSITEEGMDDVKDGLDKIANIDGEPKKKTKKQVTEEMMATSKVWEDIMSNWTEEENPLQATYEVKVVDLKYIDEVASQIREIKGVDTLSYGEGLIKPLISVFDAIKEIGIIIVIALILVTAFLIANTIKITIFSRKREIQIMRLVGASNINIKLPFMIEGLILGMIGSIIPILITCYGYIKLVESSSLEKISPFLILVKPTPFIYVVSGILLLIGMIVGMIGSYQAVRKHLKI